MLLLMPCNKKRAGYQLFFVGLLGFEPRQTESKSVVLPLHHNPVNYPIIYLECKNKGCKKLCQMYFKA